MAETTIDVDPPLHNITPVEADVTSVAGSEIFPDVDDEHPFASVTVYEKGPAETVYDPVPVYGSVPPEAVTLTIVVPPLHKINPAEEFVVSIGGSVTAPEIVDEHPFASVTVYVKAPE